MSLSVAYRYDEDQPLKVERGEAPVKKLTAREKRVKLWIRRQYQKQDQEALKILAADIAEIQEVFPGWTPLND